MKNISPAFRMLLRGKESPCNASEAGDVGSIRGSERSPGVGNSNLLHYSCLEKHHGQRSLVGDTELSDWTTVRHIHYVFHYHSVQFSSVAHSCPTLCNPMDCSTPGFPVHHQLPESTQTHVHWVGDAIQPCLLSPSLPAFNSPASGSFPVSQFFTSSGQGIGVSASASVLPMNSQDWSPLGWTGWIFLQSKELSRVSSNTAVQKHRFFGTQLSL